MPALTCPDCRTAFDIESDGSCPFCGWAPSQGITDLFDPNQSRSRRPVIPITTGNDVPGFEIETILGPVFAMTVRSRDIVSQTGAKLKSLVGGELVAMTKALEQSRFQTLLLLEQRAVVLGADAIIGMRFDVSEMAGTWTEVCAYGTAVRTRRASADS